VVWKRIGTARLLVETQPEATLIPVAAIQRNARAGLRHRRSSGAGRSERSETVITKQHKEGSVSCMNVIRFRRPR
jgi:hypothetical protein